MSANALFAAFLLAASAPGARALSQEEKEILRDVQELRDAKQVQAPVLDTLNELKERKAQELASAAQAAQDRWDGMLRGYEERREELRTWLWGACIGILAAALFGVAFGRSGWTRSVAGLGYGLGCFWLYSLSTGAAVLAFKVPVNPWSAMPSELLVPPLVCLAGSALLKRLVDASFPMVRALLTAAAAPAASALFTGIVKTF